MNAAAGEVRRFPWDEVIALGLGLLRLPPRHFWAMSPREFTHMLTGLAGMRSATPPPARRDLETLMERFPDTNEEQGR